MIARALCCALLMPSFLVAELQFSVVEGGSERAVGGLVEIGSTAAGDLLDTVFRIRNAASTTNTVQKVSISGTAFSLAKAVTAPVPLAAGGVLDVTVRFQPPAPGSYSAALTVNDQTLLLLGVARPGLVVLLEQSGKPSALAPGASVDFGTVDSGARATRRFLLQNPGALTVSFSIAIRGTGFHGPAGLPSSVDLGPGGSVWLEVAFEPQAAGTVEGALDVAGRTYSLRGVAGAPPLPKPTLVFQPQAVHSAQQAKLSIRLAAPSRAAAGGRVRLDFVPAAASGPNDPAILFPATNSRTADFSVNAGEDLVRFSGLTEIEFQTGTTAGSLTFTLEWGGEAASARLVVPSEPVGLDSKQVVRAAGRIELQLAGFDNSRSVSQLAFAFFDQEGNAVEPGRIAIDVSPDFQRFFESSALGGVFALRATFPVTGDTARLAGLEVEIINAAGSTRTGRIAF